MNTRIYCLNENQEENREYLEEAAAVLREGGLVAFPTETVYGLGGNGLNPEASRKIYEAKGRPSDNPLILHIAHRRELDSLVSRIPEEAELLMKKFWPGPMTLIFEKSDLVPRETTGGLSTVAIRMPSHPGARALIEAAGLPIAAPSANLSGRPSPTTARHVAEDLDGRIDMILDGGPVEIGLESTIIDVSGSVPMILRPGYISQEQIRDLLGACEWDPAILKKPGEDFRPKAPGMKYRHYAPKAEMVIVEGEWERAAKEICRLVSEQKKLGRKVGILCGEETRKWYTEGLVKTIGTRQREETIAHNLYYCLREFDEADVDVIYSESFGEGALGAAVMNRLLKAAGYRVIKV
ncbi:MAG: L-threonylcarbamoyladenylate synthase [Clostridiales bacterium]|nr:L-threonylcarbamoyladenylate synthase [Clostridiales bacterium]